MKWFKEVFGSQYGFSSQSSSQGSWQTSSQEPKVRYVKEKNETGSANTENDDLTVSQFEEYDETTQSTKDSCYIWSGVIQSLDI